MLSREGHRQRLREAYLLNGADALPPHNVIELILTYAIPRRDVRELSYEILNHFDNSLERMFNADIDELCGIKGVGESTAMLIKLFGDIPEAFINNRKDKRPRLNDYVKIKEYVSNNFSGIDEESLIILYSDNHSEIVCEETIASGDFDINGIDTVSILEKTFKNNVSSIIVVHQNPEKGYSETAENDIGFLGKLKGVLRSANIGLTDFIVVGNDGNIAMSYDIRFIEYFDIRR